MNVHQPIENPNIPVELVKQITAVRNQITLSQAEVIRLSELALSSKYEINELVKQKVDLEEQIAKLSGNKENLTKEVEALATNVTDLKKQKLDIDTSIEEKLKDFTIKSEEFAEEKKALDEQKADVIRATENVDLMLKNHNEDKAVFQAKVDKLHEALK